MKTFNKILLLYQKITNKNLKLGKNVTIDYKTKIYSFAQEIILHDNVYLRSRRKGYQAGMPFPTTLLIDVPDARIEIGMNSRLNGVYIHAQKSIEIGKNCVIAAGVNIIDSNGHNTNSADRTKGRDIPEKIYIGDNVWIGLNALILKGTIIGKNSVIAAGSVVKGKYPDNSFIAGNPAVFVKRLLINENSNS